MLKKHSLIFTDFNLIYIQKLSILLFYYFISRYIIRNNIPKCLLESDFLASCSGTPFNLLYFPKIFGK